MAENTPMEDEIHRLKTELERQSAELQREINERRRIEAALLGDITERKQADMKRREREERLSAILNTAADAIIVIDPNGCILSVNPATERMFGYSAGEIVGQNVNLLMPSPYREAHDGYLANFRRTGQARVIGIGREVVAQRKDGSIFPVDLAVSDMGPLQQFTGIIRDITQRKDLEREVVEIASVEQRRIGQDLHDSVGQELTALNLLSGDLAETLRTDPANASHLLTRMTDGLRRCRTELRAVLRGLLPVPVDSLGLMAALADLASHTQNEGRALCSFECPRPVSLTDNLTATHLYLIAQEAVHNALKHAQSRHIRLRLEWNPYLILTVQDDGIGLPAQPSDVQGLGLRIMSNRAAIIGATLTLERVQPNGTRVVCALPRINHVPH
jgi:PAS domain S-box-containing protein